MKIAGVLVAPSKIVVRMEQSFEEGSEVEFDAVQNSKGFEAKNVILRRVKVPGISPVKKN